MVWAFEVHHFKPDWLSAEVFLISEEDIYQNLADWGAGKARDNPMEYGPAALELSLLDSQLLHCILIQDVDIATSIYQNSREASCPPISGKGGFQNQGVGTWIRHHLWVISSAPTDRLLGQCMNSGVSDATAFTSCRCSRLLRLSS